MSVDTQRQASTEWVPIADMVVTPAAQRKYVPADAARIAATFDLEALGYPLVNYRDGRWWIVDGQHRIGALKIMGWEDQKIECEAYRGLTEAQEADLFLRRDDRRAISAPDKFRIAVTAGRADEVEISKIAAGLDLRIGKGGGSIQCVGTLRRVYLRGGPTVLGRALLIIREAYGDMGFAAAVVDGIGLIVQRYGDQLNTEKAIKALNAKRGGVRALEQRAEVLVRTTGNPKGGCIAAAAVEIINGEKGRKLPDWWNRGA